MRKKIGILLFFVTTGLGLKAQNDSLAIIAYEDSLAYIAYEDSIMRARLDSPVRYNAFFLELGGNNALWSINYDRVIIGFKDVYLTARVGYTHIIRYEETYPELKVEMSRNFFPVEVNLMYDYFARHFFGVGLGSLLTFDKEIIRNQRIHGAGLAFPKIKYRYQGLEGLFANVELGAWYLIPNEEGHKKQFIFSPGVALGYCF